MKIYLAITLFVIFGSILFAQNDKNEFSKTENLEREKIVYFHIIGINDDFHKKDVWNSLEGDEKISNVVIDDHNYCKMRVNKDVTIQYVEQIVDKHNVSISHDESFQTEKPQLIFTPKDTSAKETTETDSYPVLIDTGNPKEDEKRLGIERKKWQEKHPEEWKKMLENRNK